jgi:IclR family transcriptional regulator, KDG regulon repressor
MGAMAEMAVKSARRVFEILEYFDRERRRLGLKDLLDGLGCSPAGESGLRAGRLTPGHQRDSGSLRGAGADPS